MIRHSYEFERDAATIALPRARVAADLPGCKLHTSGMRS
jgi:hypothetical protein